MAEIYIGPRFCFGEDVRKDRSRWNGSATIKDDTGVIWVNNDRLYEEAKEEYEKNSQPSGEYVSPKIFTKLPPRSRTT